MPGMALLPICSGQITEPRHPKCCRAGYGGSGPAMASLRLHRYESGAECFQPVGAASGHERDNAAAETALEMADRLLFR